MKVSTREFDRMVERSIGRIPDEIRRALENVLISVVPEPDPDLLEELGMAPDESLMGLYQGVSLAERSVTDPPLYPDTIFIFQRGVEEACGSLEEMEREIEITVVHEIAHFLGMSEERLAELGYG